MTISFSRTSLSDGASEVLTIVKLDSGESFYSEWLEAESPFLVQITSGPNVGDDFVGIYDLDGEKLESQALGNHASWEVADDVPADVIAAVAEGWESGSNTVARL